MNDDMTTDEFDPAEIQALTALARSVTGEDRTLDRVPDDLWASISAQVGSEAGSVGPAEPPASVIRLADRRSTRMLAIAAVALVALGITGALALSARSGDDAELVASSSLDALAEGFTGTVDLESTDDGFRLDLDLGELPATDQGYYELWLIKSLETGEMQSLGFVDGSGTIDLPPGLDPDEYATVDISIEPLDGVPTHSGNSVLRGTLG